MLCAVFAILQCGFISFALGKVVIFHWECGSGSVHARMWSGGVFVFVCVCVCVCLQLIAGVRYQHIF